MEEQKKKDNHLIRRDSISRKGIDGYSNVEVMNIDEVITLLADRLPAGLPIDSTLKPSFPG